MNYATLLLLNDLPLTIFTQDCTVVDTFASPKARLAERPASLRVPVWGIICRLGVRPDRALRAQAGQRLALSWHDKTTIVQGNIMR